MNSKDYDNFFVRLTQKGANLICPVCGCSKIATTDGFIHLPTGDNTRLTPFTSIQCVHVTCDECGYVRIFNMKIALKQ